MGKYLGDFMKEHNIKSSLQLWKNSWLLIAFVFLAIIGLAFLLVTGGDKTVDVDDAKNNFESGAYAQAAKDYSKLLLQEQSDEQKAELLLAQGRSLLYIADFKNAFTVLEQAEAAFEQVKDNNGVALAKKYILEGKNMQNSSQTNNEPTDSPSDSDLTPEEMEQITSEL